MELLHDLNPILQIFWIIAIPISIIFFIQIIFTLIGINWSENFNHQIDEFSSSEEMPFQVFTFRNLINFLTSFSWSGIAFYSSFSNKSLVIVLATLFGIGFILIFFLMLKQLNKLSENNAFDISKTIGMVAEVYLKIPRESSGKGKILLSYNGSIQELDAITKEKQDIPQQTQVKIIFNNNFNQVEVKRI